MLAPRTRTVVRAASITARAPRTGCDPGFASHTRGRGASFGSHQRGSPACMIRPCRIPRPQKGQARSGATCGGNGARRTFTWANDMTRPSTTTAGRMITKTAPTPGSCHSGASCRALTARHPGSTGAVDRPCHLHRPEVDDPFRQSAAAERFEIHDRRSRFSHVDQHSS
jgi:hypothetical protein